MCCQIQLLLACSSVEMTDCDLSASKDETSKLCSLPDSSYTDDLPSLDALSFEHEHCPSRNCLCHNRKRLQNNRNSSGLTAFGVQSSGTPILSHNPASCTSHLTVTKDPICTVPLIEPAFQPLINGHPIVAGASSNATPTSNTCDHVFGSSSGSCHHSVDDMQSFAQLRSAVPSTTSESAATGRPLTFPHNHRAGQLLNDPMHLVQSIDLSELQSVLPSTVEESLPESNCPVHLPTTASERIPACTCGQQASRLDDCTSDELAAYFDNFCYIPKNMSPMAEMMYM